MYITSFSLQGYAAKARKFSSARARDMPIQASICIALALVQPDHDVLYTFVFTVIVFPPSMHESTNCVLRLCSTLLGSSLITDYQHMICSLDHDNIQLPINHDNVRNLNLPKKEQGSSSS